MAISPASPTGVQADAGGDGLQQAGEELVVNEEAVRAKSRRAPTLPTQEEIDDHELTHLPPRAWCRYCVRGGCVSDPHTSIEDRGRKRVPHIDIDYWFLGTKDDETVLPLLAIKESETG